MASLVGATQAADQPPRGRHQRRAGPSAVRRTGSAGARRLGIAPCVPLCPVKAVEGRRRENLFKPGDDRPEVKGLYGLNRHLPAPVGAQAADARALVGLQCGFDTGLTNGLSECLFGAHRLPIFVSDRVSTRISNSSTSPPPIPPRMRRSPTVVSVVIYVGFTIGFIHSWLIVFYPTSASSRFLIAVPAARPKASVALDGGQRHLVGRRCRGPPFPVCRSPWDRSRSGHRSNRRCREAPRPPRRRGREQQGRSVSW